MSKRQSKSTSDRWKIPELKSQALTFCSRPRTLVVFGALSLTVVLVAWGARPGTSTASSDDLSEEQLESDFLAMGAVGVSDSANPGAGSVRTQFDFGDEESEPAPVLNDGSTFLPGATASSSVPDFELDTQPDGLQYGRPVAAPDSQHGFPIQQAAFRQPEPSYSSVPSARVTANQAVWLTGSIETP